MPKRPWITPDDLRTYSDDEGITNRPDEKLQIDISRAESYVLTYTHNRNLLDDEQYPEVPEAVRTATILIAQQHLRQKGIHQKVLMITHIQKIHHLICLMNSI